MLVAMAVSVGVMMAASQPLRNAYGEAGVFAAVLLATAAYVLASRLLGRALR